MMHPGIEIFLLQGLSSVLLEPHKIQFNLDLLKALH